jgi:hypothetical protein
VRLRVCRRRMECADVFDRSAAETINARAENAICAAQRMITSLENHVTIGCFASLPPS